MKQLIIQSLSLSNSLYKKSFIKIIIFTSLGLFFIFIFIFYNFNKIKEKENNNKRTAIQKIIVNSIVSSSKYGDIIYSRANSLQLGKSLGLIDLGICDKGRDLFERINETRCRVEERVSDEVIVTKENTYLNNQSYTLEFEWEKEKDTFYSQVAYSFFISLVIAVILIFPIQLFLLNFILKKIQTTVTFLINNQFEKISARSNNYLQGNEYIPVEFRALAKFIQTKAIELKQATEDNATISVAKQVSHDIRSPLAALTMALEDIQNLKEEHLYVLNSSIQRINDIANNLLNNKTKLQINTLQVKSLGDLVDSLVSEKRVEYRKQKSIQIQLDQTRSYGLFVSVNG